MTEGQSKLEQLQGNVEEVRIIMQDNYTNVKEREEKLKRLDERAEALLESTRAQDQSYRSFCAAIQTSFSEQSTEKRTIMEETQTLLQKVNQDLDEVQTIMQNNVNNINVRGENLQDLDVRAERLLECSRLFKRTTFRLNEHQDQHCVNWKTCCYCLLFLLIVCIVVSVIITGTHYHWFS
ncbi:hypothetical protein C0J45_18500 [Silurus meridionalis]|nr:hypothetical protein C0J45_18500 [Silurus meridionalis]